jgi:4-amino-4-deoxy-L-arabinose transferase-like glycosyltransferase
MLRTGPQSAFCILLILLAFALRVYRLDALSLRGDESFTVLFSANPLPQLLEGIRTVEPNPPLYYLLLHGLMFLFGQGDFAMRYVSALFGVLAVPLVYQLGREFIPGDQRLSHVVGLLAAFLLASNPYQIWHSQDVRNYTLWPALSLASLYLLLRALRENRRSLWIGYVVTALLSLYTHYYDAFVVLFENVFVFLVYRRDRPLLKRWLLAQAILAALYLPWPLFASSRPFTYVDVTDYVPGLWGIVRQSLTIFTLGETLPHLLVTALLPALALLLALGLGFAFRLDRRAFAFLLLYLAVPILCVFLLAQWRPLFRERYLNVIAPAYTLAFALGLAALARLRRGPALAMVVGLAVLVIPTGLSLSHYTFDPRYAKSPDWRGLAAYLEAQARAEDVIVQNYPDPTLEYYYRGSAQRLVLPDRSAVDQIGDLPVDRAATGNTLQELLSEHQHLWLLPQRSGWDPQGFVEGWLNRRARKVYEQQVAGFRLAVYERAKVVPLSIQHLLDVRLGEGIGLLGYNLEPTAVRPGEAVRLTLYWQAQSPMDTAYTVFTHLLDADGQIQAQQDSQPQDGGFPTTDWLPGDIIRDEYTLALPSDAPPGEYTLEVGMYRLETGQRLPAYDADGQRWPEDAIRLDLSIEVAP